jgi:E3 ubiquitin-protein ligase TRIP12
LEVNIDIIYINFILGFKNLSPRMTVVVKQPENKLEFADDYLPTVMTCQNYLKIPSYSNVKVLKQKLYLAMDEGANAFHLS